MKQELMKKRAEMVMRLINGDLGTRLFNKIMDEPESGLSANLVEEFQQRVVYYMDALTNKGMDVTFFITSHQPSLISSPFVLTHSVNSFKKNRRSKSKHTKVFI